MTEIKVSGDGVLEFDKEAYRRAFEERGLTIIIDDVFTGEPDRVRLHRFMQSLDSAGLHVMGGDYHRENLLRGIKIHEDLAAFVNGPIVVPNVPDPPENTERSVMRPRSCDFTKNYRGDRPPTCWNGRGCAECLQKYKEKQSRGGKGGRR
jgi:hypothetical protein